MTALRIILGVVVGLAAGVGLVFVGEMLNHQLWPPPEDLQVTDPEAVRAYFETAPLEALFGLPLVWIVAAGAGSFLGAKIANRAWAGWIVGGLLLAATLLNLSLIPHPLWMWATGVLGVALAAYFAAKLGAA